MITIPCAHLTGVFNSGRPGSDDFAFTFKTEGESTSINPHFFFPTIYYCQVLVNALTRSRRRVPLLLQIARGSPTRAHYCWRARFVFNKSSVQFFYFFFDFLFCSPTAVNPAKYLLTFQGKSGSNANPLRFATAMQRSYFVFSQVLILNVTMYTSLACSLGPWNSIFFCAYHCICSKQHNYK